MDQTNAVIKIEQANGNPVLNRAFDVCEKCAYGIFEIFYKADIMCKKCDTEEKAETD